MTWLRSSRQRSSRREPDEGSEPPVSRSRSDVLPTRRRQPRRATLPAQRRHRSSPPQESDTSAVAGSDARRRRRPVEKCALRGGNFAICTNCEVFSPQARDKQGSESKRTGTRRRSHGRRHQDRRLTMVRLPVDARRLDQRAVCCRALNDTLHSRNGASGLSPRDQMADDRRPFGRCFQQHSNTDSPFAQKRAPSTTRNGGSEAETVVVTGLGASNRLCLGRADRSFHRSLVRAQRSRRGVIFCSQKKEACLGLGMPLPCIASIVTVWACETRIFNITVEPEWFGPSSWFGTLW
ncbi:unnamed protein product [uncultured bacterium]|nr:unnamed protein product [uncultured bacterium]